MNMRTRLFRAVFAACFPLTSQLSVSWAADIAPFRLYDRGLNSETGISYFDHEGNSPFKGDARSKMKFETDALHFTFDINEGNGSYIGWYVAAREKTISFVDKTVLRFEMKGSANISPSEFQIGIRTANLPAETNGAKIFLSELGYEKFPTKYTLIEIPVSLLYEKEPNLDLQRAVHLLIFGIIEPQKNVAKAEVWIKDARWSWDIQKTARGRLATLPGLLFDTGKADLKPEVKPFLDRVIEVFSSEKEGRLVVEGHTDNEGSEALNLRLSRQRAQAVADYLVSGKIDAARIDVVAHGQTRPVGDNTTDAGRSRNRRVDVLFPAAIK